MVDIQTEGTHTLENRELQLISHEHTARCYFQACDNCHKSLCLALYPLDSRICELCTLLLNTNQDFQPYILQLTNLLSEASKAQSEFCVALSSAEEKIKDLESAYTDFDGCAARRISKLTKLSSKIPELDAKIHDYQSKIEKYKSSLVLNTTRANMITADRDRIKYEYSEAQKKISEFQEMIKEQEEENTKLYKDIEIAKEENAKQQENADILRLNEGELKKRIKRMQTNIEKVRSENQSLEVQLKFINDVDRLKSGTISVISEKVSLIIGSHLEPKAEKSNELTLQMKQQMDEVMNLYKDLNQHKRSKSKKDEISHNTCKCTIQ